MLKRCMPAIPTKGTVSHARMLCALCLPGNHMMPDIYTKTHTCIYDQACCGRCLAGDCLQVVMLPQVDIERSYALVLHKLVRRINGKLTHSLRQALDEQLSLDANCQFSPRAAAAYCRSDQTVVRLQPLTNMYQAQLAQMAGLLDVRVFRRVARELWNAAAGVSKRRTTAGIPERVACMMLCFSWWSSKMNWCLQAGHCQSICSVLSAD